MTIFDIQPQTVTRQLPGLLERRKLDPGVIREYVMSRGRFGETWLFAVLDTLRMGKLEQYKSDELLHHFSTNLGGACVKASNSNGLRYGVLVAGRPGMPGRIEMPADATNGSIQIGQNIRGEGVSVANLESLGHVTVAGMTGSGKSNAVRLILNQAVAAGAALLLVDPDEQSFGEYEDHPALLAPVANAGGAEPVIGRAILEKYGRAQAFKNLRAERGGRVENLDEYNRLAARPLPRVFVVVDEISTLITRLGGPRGELANNLFELVTGGRKFGIHVIMAGQDFRRETTGALISQSRTVLCFQVKEASTSRVVLGEEGAVRLRIPGLALTTAWGLVQTYAAPVMGQAEEAARPETAVSATTIAQAARSEVEEMAEAILQAGALGWSKRRIAAQLFNRAYGGAFCAKLDRALEFATATQGAGPELRLDGALAGAE